MTETNWRALCAELTDVLAELPFGTCEELVIRARAALASPGSGLPQRPENFEFALDFLGGPENDELLAYVEQLEARAALAADGPVVQSREPASVVGEPSDEELNRLLWYEFTTSTGHGERTDPIGFARAVLARWGHQPAPIAGRRGFQTGCTGGGMTELSPAARAIRDAVLGTYAPSVPRDDNLWRLEQRSTVAALRALADHRQAPFTLGQPGDHWSPDDRTRRELRNLADELEGTDG